MEAAPQTTSGSFGRDLDTIQGDFSKGIGTIMGYQADVKLKEGTKPIFKKCRSVAYALQPTLDAELAQEEGILEPVHGLPHW